MAGNNTDSLNMMVGSTILSVTGLDVGSNEVVFVTDKGTFTFQHFQDCCESVTLEDYDGDVEDLVNQAIRLADERVECEDGGFQYTFYHIRTDGGDVFLRFGGESHYYSLDVTVTWDPPALSEDDN